MIYRMKIALALLQELGGTMTSDSFHSILFLFCHEFSEHNHYYHFIPTVTGPLSLQAEEDKHYLIHKEIVSKNDDWVILENKKRYAVG